MLESNPPRNNQLESHRSDEPGRGCKGAPFPLLHHFDTSPNTSKNSCLVSPQSPTSAGFASVISLREYTS
jgi:hypothetical protein